MKKHALYSFLFVVLFNIFFVAEIFAQGDCSGEVSAKARKYLDQALSEYNKSKNIHKTKEFLEKAIEEDEAYYEAYIYKARFLYELGDDKGVEEAYKKAIELCPDQKPEPYFVLGEMVFKLFDYKQTIEYLDKFKTFEKAKPNQKIKADSLLKLARFRQHAIDNPVPFNPVVVDSLSTADGDVYLPIISSDNQIAFYTRRLTREVKESLDKITVEEFSASYRHVNGVFDRGDKLGSPFNEGNNEGGSSVSIDNNDLYFTICKPDATSYVNCDIYFSKFARGNWGKIVSLGKAINSGGTWESQPSIGPDGKTLYFAAAKPIGMGGADIYVSRKNAQGEWQKPENLGRPVNTGGNEKSPFIHTDGRTMYFSSDSLIGMGGYDMFVTKLNDDGTWSEPKNLGYPINTEADELGFFVSTDGKHCFFSSNNLKGNGGLDIFEFELYEQARPDRVLFVKGEVKDETTGKPVAATVQLKGLSSDKVIDIAVDSTTGKYVTAVKYDDDYLLTVKKQGATTAAKLITQNDPDFAGISKVNFTTKPIEVGNSFSINDVFFATASAELTDNSKLVLESVYEFLMENATVKLGVYGHTDNVSDSESNQILSESRAKSVFDFLIEKGIPIERLTYKGFGETKPIANNASEEGRAKNRRTEFVILEK